MKIRLILAAALVALLALLSLPAGAGALAVPPDVKAAKKAEGPYVDEIQTAKIKQGKTKSFFWRVTNTLQAGVSLNFNDAAGDSEGYKIQWYKGKKPRASRKISSDVKGDGYDFTLNGGAAKHFTAKVKAVDASETLCLGGQATDNKAMVSDAAYFQVNGLCI